MTDDEKLPPLGLMCQYQYPISRQVELVQYAERKGFTQAWQSEYRLERDAVTPAVAYASATQDISVGLGVINNWTRNTALIAQTMSTITELAGPNRVLGGIGAWWDPLASRVGIDRRRPLRAVRETVETVRLLLDGETVTYDGEFVSLEDVAVEFEHHDEDPPLSTDVYVGATGFKMLELTGQFADGCLGNYVVSPGYDERALEALERGAERAGRSLDQVDRSQLIAVAMDEDYDEAIAGGRRFFLEYFAPRPTVSEVRSGSVPQDVVDAMMDELGEWPADEPAIEAALEVIPEDVVKEVIACGRPAECRERVREYVETGFCQCPVLYPVNGNVEAVVDAFAEGYRE
jgi:alkanesulfonate monooxygenase SsuD/methylene tetrahydromethanopterin reductase-like flavin-dependent oxidoreductase (luciferase family)